MWKWYKTQIESELSHERETAKNYAGHSCYELITAGVIWSQMVWDSPRKSQIDQDDLIWSEVVADGEQIVWDGPMVRDGFSLNGVWNEIVPGGQIWS